MLNVRESIRRTNDMSTRLHILLLAAVLFTLFEVIKRVREKKLLLQYTLTWLTLLVVLLLVALFPQLLSWISDLIGIALPINMVFFLGFCFSLLIIFELTQAVSKMSVQIKDLTQKIALLDKKREDESK